MSASQSSQRVKIDEGFYMVPAKRTAPRVQSAMLFKPSNPSVGATYVLQNHQSTETSKQTQSASKKLTQTSQKNLAKIYPAPQGTIDGGKKIKAKRTTKKAAKAKTTSKKAKK